MKIEILTLFPEMFDGFIQTSIIHRAIDKGIVEVSIHNIRDYTLNKHKKVDDYPYGGGQGMVMACQPVVDAIRALKQDDSKVFLMSPQGRVFKQNVAYELSQIPHMILVCGHYEGFDERILHYVDGEFSIGDYVLTGGELASMVIADACIRLVEGAIQEDSHQDDSFSNQLLEYPQYTRPADFEGYTVPDVLISGHHENIRLFRLEESIKKTLIKRPDLLTHAILDTEGTKILTKIKNELKKD